MVVYSKCVRQTGLTKLQLLSDIGV